MSTPPEVLAGAAAAAFVIAMRSAVAMVTSVLNSENAPWWKIYGLFVGSLVNFAACVMLTVWLVTGP